MITIANPLYDSVFKFMTVEDEFYSAIEKRDTEIMQQRQQIEESKARLAEQDQLIGRSIQALLKTGMTAEDIAATLNIDSAIVKSMGG